MAMLNEDFVRSGNWLFRWRGPIPLLMVALMALWLSQALPNPTSAWTPAWQSLGIGLALLGLLIRAHTVGHAPAATSGRNTKKQIAARLNVTGMYSIVRHPLYLGNFLMWIGVASAAQSGWFMFICALMFALYYERIMFAEERFLSMRFGREYDIWADKTPAFLPKVWQWKSPNLAFSLRGVLRRECPSLLSVTAAFFIIDLVKDSLSGDIEVQLFWVVSFTSAILIALTVKWFKQHTCLLNVEGR